MLRMIKWVGKVGAGTVELHSEGGHVENTIDGLYRDYRKLAFSIAYRMLGVISDAEDAVQDLFADMVGRDLSEVRHMKAYIAKWMTNRCINVLQSPRRTRENYIGEWLPEPLIESADQPDQAAERADSLSYAYLVMLERLTPTERAVFLLREVFEYEYEEIADIVGKSASNCRKIMSRAKEHARKPYPSVEDADARNALVTKFVSAFQHYDVEALLALLSEDAELITDGGSHPRSAKRPIVGRSRVVTLLTSPKAFKAMRFSWQVSFTSVNGEMNMVYCDRGVVKAVCCCELTAEQDRISNVYVILNPDKLNHISL